MTEIVLRTKFIPPPPRPGFVPRERLNTRLLGALRAPLLLVSAPAGFGKTTATAAAARTLADNADVRLAWLSLEARDDEPARFWRYFLAALQAGAGLGGDLAERLTAPQPPPIQPLLETLLNVLAARPYHLLHILDDYHLISQPGIHRGLGFLLEHAPPNLHLALVSRADPPLSLHLLRARGQVVEVRAADLRFDEAEAEAFLQQAMSLTLTDTAVATLTAQTEGWAVGLQLAGLALQGYAAGPPAHADLVERLARSNRYVLEYLTEEVLAQQPAYVQRFLLQTAVLDRLCGPLCDAVTRQDGSQEILAMLETRNLFVIPIGPPEFAQNAPASEQRRWFRYHQLFGDLLLGLLRQQHPEEINTLHRRAATWYAGEGDLEAALEHALSGHDFTHAVALLDTLAGDVAMEGRALAIERWLQRLPPELRLSSPRATLAYAWSLLLRGRYDEIPPCLEAIEAAANSEEGPLAGEALALRASLASTQGRADAALPLARQAVAAVSDANLFVQALAHFALAGALRETGDVEAAIAAYERAIPLCRAAQLLVPEMLARAHLAHLCTIQGRLRQAERVTRPVADERQPAAGAARVALGAVLLEWNELNAAEDQLRAGVALARQSGHNAAEVLGYVSLARLRRAEGDAAAAQLALDEAAALLQAGAPAWLRPLLIAERVVAQLDEDALDTAVHLLAHTGNLAADGHVAEVIPLARARLHLRRSELAEAVALLDDVIAAAEDGGRQGRAIEGRLLRALAHSAAGRADAARTNLTHALTLAEPEGYVRLFTEAGPGVAALLAQIDSPYARRLLQEFDTAVQQAVTPALPEPLTERETDVLQLMARGLTYQQIADELVVSINTVRHHIKGIYEKLQVDKRTLAVERARVLGLL